MFGLGRAAMPQLGVGRGRTVLPFPPGRVESVSPASEPQPASYTQPSHAGGGKFHLSHFMKHSKTNNFLVMLKIGYLGFKNVCGKIV